MANSKNNVFLDCLKPGVFLFCTEQNTSLTNTRSGVIPTRPAKRCWLYCLKNASVLSDLAIECCIPTKFSKLTSTTVVSAFFHVYIEQGVQPSTGFHSCSRQSWPPGHQLRKCLSIKLNSKYFNFYSRFAYINNMYFKTRYFLVHYKLY